MTDDVIVVGARCAGAPTAMLLARQGHRVLLVDRARFPSDTVSTHLLHQPGVAALARWGLLDRLVATGCPPIDTYRFDFGPVVLEGAPGVAYGPRRTVLDALLVDAAAEAGAEVRQGFSVEEIVVEDGRVTGIRGGGGRTERAPVVVGADGRHSLVARAVRPEEYHTKPPLLAGYYAYWSGLPMDGRFETYIREDRGFSAWPTHDGRTIVVGGWPYAEFEANKADVAGNFLAMLEQAPPFAARVRAGTRQTRFAGAAVPNYFRTPYGPGWALVGDAGYNRDFITAQGMQDAFLDAELVAGALHDVLRGTREFGPAMAAYRSARDSRVLAMYEFTTELATLQPPSPELAGLLGAMPGDRAAMDGFTRVAAGVTSPAEFFAPPNVERILGGGRKTG
ncbi:MAG TPA: NAD(P)/FAD-dependent oxidoreductase [Mycobacteriales bacterium]|nr:NAD(P)/FAD-dependent oxidoreductase [Mycobacteriales bacterium]